MKTLIALFITISLLQVQNVDYSYPPLIAGSTWGNIYQQYFKIGDYESMIKLTSKESMDKFGADSIRQYYQSMDFGYKLSLKSWTSDKNIYVLNYSAFINATKVIVRMKLAKGDTAKIILPDDFANQKIFLHK